MKLPEDWKKYNVSLGLVATVLVAAWFTFQFLDTRHVLAGDYRRDTLSLKDGQLAKEQRSLERTESSLRSKKVHVPARFDRKDEDDLRQLQLQIKEIKQERKELRKK